MPIITVDAQATDGRHRGRPGRRLLHDLKDYIDSLDVEGKPVRHGVTVRELGAPEGGTLGGSQRPHADGARLPARLRPRLRGDPRRPELRPALARASTRPTTTSTFRPRPPTRRRSPTEPEAFITPPYGSDSGTGHARGPDALMEATTGVGPFRGAPARDHHADDRRALAAATARRAADWPRTTRVSALGPVRLRGDAVADPLRQHQAPARGPGRHDPGPAAAGAAGRGLAVLR